MHESSSARFAPLVELPRRRLFGFALEHVAPSESQLGWALALTDRWRDRVAPTMLVDAALEDIDTATVDQILARARGIDSLILRIPRYESSMQVPQLDRLLEAGVTIAVRELDVRGADLGILAGAPIDIVELPAGSVAAMDHDQDAADHVRALIDLSHRHDWLALAWHVERPTQLALLERLGCDLIGGPVAGRRLDLVELDAAVARYLPASPPP